MALNFTSALPTDEVASRSQHKGIAAELVQNPGMWAQIGPEDGYGKRASATSTASDINKDKNNAYKASEDGKFEAVARTVDDKHLVFARYLPAAGVPATPVTTAPETDAQDEDGTESEAPAFSG